jgi:GT2 family glycosyltransferase
MQKKLKKDVTLRTPDSLVNNKVQLSVIIVSHAHGSQLIDTLNTLLENYNNHPNFEIQLLLNVPEEARTEEFLSGFPLPVKINRNQKIGGLSKNLNLILDQIETPFFLILNPDTMLPPENIRRCCTEIVKTGAALLSCPSRNMQNEELPNIRYYPSPFSILSERLIYRRKRLQDFREIISGKNIKPFWFQGSYLMGRTDIAREIRFDEKFFLYFEDVDFCRRLLSAGHKLHICRDTFFLHHFNRKSSSLQGLHLLHHLKSAIYYFRMSYRLRKPYD